MVWFSPFSFLCSMLQAKREWDVIVGTLLLYTRYWWQIYFYTKNDNVITEGSQYALRVQANGNIYDGNQYALTFVNMRNIMCHLSVRRCLDMDFLKSLSAFGVGERVGYGCEWVICSIKKKLHKLQRILPRFWFNEFLLR